MGDGRAGSEVVVRRLGGAWFPVQVLFVFEDGSERREAWDGRARSKTIVVEHAAKLRYATVDPGRVLLLEVDVTNNSRRRESDAAFPAAKWASQWVVWFQDRLAAMSFFP